MNQPPLAVRLAVASRAPTFAFAVTIVLTAWAAAACAVTTTASAPTTAAVPPSTRAEATPAQPPVARLRLAPQPPVDGSLGSYTWLGTGSDSPWLPGTAVALPAGRTASVTLEPSIPIVSWRIRRGTATGDAQRVIARGDAIPIEFAVPDVSGTIQLAVEYGPAGSAVYYWAVTPVRQ